MFPHNNEEFAHLEVERRSVPRAPIPGWTAEFLSTGEPATKKTFTVREVGLESLFIEGPLTSEFILGHQYPIRLIHNNKSVECLAQCLRIEEAPRSGAIFKLPPENLAARDLIRAVLKPSEVPVGVD